jgi:serine beta-lactamase-like protein LACTB
LKISGFGFADLENRVLANPNTVMRIASISKSLTMMVVAKLWEEGKLDLVTPF